MQIPKTVREQVLAELYRRFDDLSWEQIGYSDKSAAYERLVGDPLIGGKLTPFLDEGRIRVWIKDGAAKEYARALEGVGPYADLTFRALDGPECVISSALGQGWGIVDGSLVTKPMRCQAVDADGQARFLVWGPIGALKELFWHAALHKAEAHGPAPVLVVTRNGPAPIPAQQWERVGRLCATIGAECRSVQRSVTRRDR